MTASIGSVSATPSARQLRGPSPLVAIASEAPPRLVVDPPLAGPLNEGRVFIQYAVENMRIAPAFGEGALRVSPRLGHVHVTVDDLPWHFVDASGETIVVVGLPPGPHSILIELADPTHKVLERERLAFTVPSPAAAPDRPSAMDKGGP